MRLLETYVEITARDTALRTGLKNARGYVRSQVSEMQGYLDKLSFKSFNLRNMFIGGGLVAGTFYGIKASFDALVSSTVTAGSSFVDMAARTNVSVESLSSLSYMAKLTGADMGNVEKSVKFLTNSMLDVSRGSGTAKKTFEEMGIAVTGAGGNLRPVMDVLMDAADKLAGMSDATKQAAFAADLFGAKSGTMLLPMLKGGSAEMRKMFEEAKRLGIVMSTEDARAADAAGDAMDTFKMAIEGVRRTIASGIIPTLTGYVKAATEWVAVNREAIAVNVKEWLDRIGAGLNFLWQHRNVIKVIFEIAIYKAAFTWVMNLGRAVVFLAGTMKTLGAVQGITGIMALAGGAGSAVNAVNSARAAMTAATAGLAAAQAAQTGAIAFGATATALGNARVVQAAAVQITSTTAALTAATAAQTAATTGLATATTALSAAAITAGLAFGAFVIGGAVVLGVMEIRKQLREIANMDFKEVLKLKKEMEKEPVTAKAQNEAAFSGADGVIPNFKALAVDKRISEQPFIEAKKAALARLAATQAAKEDLKQIIEKQKNEQAQGNKLGDLESLGTFAPFKFGLGTFAGMRATVKSGVEYNKKNAGIFGSTSKGIEGLGQFGKAPEYGPSVEDIAAQAESAKAIYREVRDAKLSNMLIGLTDRKRINTIEQEQERIRFADELERIRTENAAVYAIQGESMAAIEAAKAKHGESVAAIDKQTIQGMMDDAASFGQAWGDMLSDAVMRSGNAFRNIADSFKAMLTRMAAESMATGLMSGLFNLFTGGIGGFSGGFLSGFKKVLGFRADGGPVSAGLPYIVGEKRPELFIPKQAGNIVPYVPKIAAPVPVKVTAPKVAAGNTTTVHDNSRYEMHFHDVPAAEMSRMNPEQFAKLFKECVRSERIKIKRTA